LVLFLTKFEAKAHMFILLNCTSYVNTFNMGAPVALNVTIMSFYS
jgi:hypothetical protein